MFASPSPRMRVVGGVQEKRIDCGTASQFNHDSSELGFQQSGRGGGGKLEWASHRYSILWWLLSDAKRDKKDTGLEFK